MLLRLGEAAAGATRGASRVKTMTYADWALVAEFDDDSDNLPSVVPLGGDNKGLGRSCVE
jgi:hypothetical protein